MTGSSQSVRICYRTAGQHGHKHWCPSGIRPQPLDPHLVYTWLCLLPQGQHHPDPNLMMSYLLSTCLMCCDSIHVQGDSDVLKNREHSGIVCMLSDGVQMQDCMCVQVCTSVSSCVETFDCRAQLLRALSAVMCDPMELWLFLMHADQTAAAASPSYQLSGTQAAEPSHRIFSHKKCLRSCQSRAANPHTLLHRSEILFLVWSTSGMTLEDRTSQKQLLSSEVSFRESWLSFMELVVCRATAQRLETVLVEWYTAAELRWKSVSPGARAQRQECS